MDVQLYFDKTVAPFLKNCVNEQKTLSSNISLCQNMDRKLSDLTIIAFFFAMERISQTGMEISCNKNVLYQILSSNLGTLDLRTKRLFTIAYLDTLPSIVANPNLSALMLLHPSSRLFHKALALQCWNALTQDKWFWTMITQSNFMERNLLFHDTIRISSTPIRLHMLSELVTLLNLTPIGVFEKFDLNASVNKKKMLCLKL